MAINGRKISSFSKLNDLTGDEFLMVAYKGKSYKIPTSLLLGNIITDITQTTNDKSGADNPVTIRISNGTEETFHVYNGKKGEPGDKGPKGETGDQGPQGVILPATDSEFFKSLIINSVTGEDYSDEELAEKMLSAKMGKYLNEQISQLKEVYFDSQEEYDLALSNGLIDDDTKYFIFAQE